MGHDPLRSGSSSTTVRALLTPKPSNECDGGPAYREQPSNCGDTYQGQPYPWPYGPSRPRASCRCNFDSMFTGPDTTLCTALFPWASFDYLVGIGNNRF